MISRPVSEKFRMVDTLFPPAGSMLTLRFLAVMNYTEMEAKVREATNNEPWVCAPKALIMLYEPCLAFGLVARPGNLTS